MTKRQQTLGLNGSIYIPTVGGIDIIDPGKSTQTTVSISGAENSLIPSTPSQDTSGIIYVVGVPNIFSQVTPTLYAIDPNNNNKLYTIDNNLQQFTSFNSSVKPAIGPDNKVYLAVNNGANMQLQVYDTPTCLVNGPCTPNILFKVTGKNVSAQASIAKDGTIYLPVGNTLYILDKTGVQISTYTSTGGYITQSATIDANGNVYVVSSDSNVQVLDNKGNFQWSLNLITSPFFPHFNPLNGDILFPSSPVIGNDGTIYIGTQTMPSGLNPPTSQAYFYALTQAN